MNGNVENRMEKYKINKITRKKKIMIMKFIKTCVGLHRKSTYRQMRCRRNKKKLYISIKEEVGSRKILRLVNK